MFQCKDILSLVSMAQVEVLAGANGMEKGIRWSYKAENLNFEKWVKGEEILVVSAPITQRKRYDLFQIISKAIRLNMSCALLLIGENYVEKVEQEVIDLAENNDFPLFAVPWDVPLIDFFEELGHAISYLDDRKDIEDNLLAEIIFGGSINEENIELKCKQMGYEISILEQVFIMHVDGMNNDEIRSYSQVLKNMFEQNDYSVIVSCYGSRIIGFLHDVATNRELVLSVFNDFETRLRENYPDLEYCLNIGEKCSSVKDLKKSFDVTSKTNGILKRINKVNQVVFYDQMGIYRLLMSYEDVEPMNKFVTDVLGEVLSYDEKNNTSLIETLWAYYCCDCNLQATADNLFAHKNTVKYRLQRIKEIAGRDLGNTFQSFEIFQALIIYYFLK